LKSFSKEVINVITLGCSKNVVDSEHLMKQLEGRFEVIFENYNDAADIVIINTCGFILDAKQESIDVILKFTELKAKGRLRKIIVMGCLSQLYKSELSAAIPEIDNIYGVNDFQKILNDLQTEQKDELLTQRVLTTPKHYAYLKIAEGCNRKCSFCAIPNIRGKNISRPVDVVLEEANWLVDKGVKELIIVAQDTTYYGMDLYKKRKLPTLLTELAKIKNLEWIRLHYSYPTGFPIEIIKLMNKYENICKYLDIPLQHIDSDILKSMKRGINEEQTKNLIKKIRSVVPDITLRSTFIAGYPGETRKQFEKLKDFIIETRFERLGVFAYSEEENTPAAKLNDSVSGKTKEKRVSEIMEIQQEISYEINREKIGKTYKTLIDRKENDYYIGRTEADSPEVDNEVLIPAKQNLVIGNFYQIKINKVNAFDIYGDVILKK
jgi:ribosomal protein S12 methylthiotransferase